MIPWYSFHYHTNRTVFPSWFAVTWRVHIKLRLTSYSFFTLVACKAHPALWKLANNDKPYRWVSFWYVHVLWCKCTIISTIFASIYGRYIDVQLCLYSFKILPNLSSCNCLFACVKRHLCNSVLVYFLALFHSVDYYHA